MKLWLLKPHKILDPDPWHPWYDKSFGHVVRAVTEDQARALVAATGIRQDVSIFSHFYGDEGRDVWLSPDKSTCIELTNQGDSAVILTDMRSA